MSAPFKPTEMRDAGFSEEEIENFLVPQVADLREAGFSEIEIQEHFELPKYPPFDVEPLVEQINMSTEAAFKEKGSELTFLEYIEAGWQQSVTGMAIRGKLPELEVPENAPTGRIVSQVASVVVDLPIFLAGGAAAAPSGAGVATPITATAGAFAGHAALRELYIQTLTNGEIATFSEFREVLSDVMAEMGKGAVVGAAVGTAGPVAAGATKPFLSPLAVTAAEKAAQIAALATAGAAVEGEFPELQDFTDAGAVIMVLTAGHAGLRYGSSRVSRIYARTGVKPHEVIENMTNDPRIIEDISSKNLSEEPRAYVEHAQENPGEIGKRIKDELRQSFDERAIEILEREAGKPKAQKEAASDVEAKEVEPAAKPVAGPKAAGKPPSALEQVKQRISFNGEKPQRKTIKQTLDSLYADWVNKQHPLNKFVREVIKEKDGDLKITENPAALAQLEPGAVARASSFIGHSPLKFRTLERVGKPMSEILEPFRKDLTDLSSYLTARVVVEREAGKKAKRQKSAETDDPALTPIDVAVARRAVKEGNAKYRQAAEDLSEFQEHVLNYFSDSGMLPKEDAALWRAATKNYVPLHRVQLEEASISKPSGAGKNVRNPVFKFRGNETLDIIDPLESIMNNTYSMILLAERNQIGLQLTKLATEFGRPEIAKLAESKPKPVGVKPDELKRAVKKWGKGKDLTMEEATVLEGFAEESFAIFRKDALRPKENQIVVFDKGKRSVWDIDPEIYRTFAAGNAVTNNIVLKVAQKATKTIRSGAILNPAFAPKALARDTFEAFIFSEGGLRFATDAMRSVADVAGKSEAYRDWEISGGPQAAMVSLDRNYARHNLEDIFETQGLGRRVRNSIRHPVEALRVTSEFQDKLSRLAEFKRVRSDQPRTKESILEAGLASRKIGLDFAQMGSIAQEVNKYSEFFTVSINGADRFIRGIKDNPVRTMARTAQSIIVPSALLHLYNRDQQWYKDQERWLKDTHWLVKPLDTIWRIPKPFEPGIFFGTGTELMIDALLEQDASAFDGFISSVLRSSTPGFIPAIAKVPVEQYANRKLFFGTPIIPQALEGGLPEYQYVSYTTELTKAIGKAIASFPILKTSPAASPLRIESVVNTMTGGLGRQLLTLADFTLRKAGALPDPEKPTVKFSELPFVRSFTVRNPSFSTQPVRDFFDKFEETSQVETTVRRLRKEGNIEAAEREVDLFGVEPVSLKQIKDAISNYMSMVRMLNRPEIPGSPDEKRQQIDWYLEQITETARLGNELFEELESEK